MKMKKSFIWKKIEKGFEKLMKFNSEIGATLSYMVL